MMVKRKLRCTVNESSAGQEIHKSEKICRLHLAELGLTAGWLADEIRARLEVLKASCRSKYLIFRFV